MLKKEVIKVKAYDCYVHFVDDLGDVIVFAETRGKAKVIAKRVYKDNGADEVEYIDIGAYRCPEYDKYYKNKDYMDWSDPETRLILVRDHDWRCCAYDLYQMDECEDCLAKPCCKEFKSYEQWAESEYERSIREYEWSQEDSQRGKREDL